MTSSDSAPAVVRNGTSLVELFGYWPSFHDAEIHRAELDRGGTDRSPSVTLTIHVFDCDDTIDENGYYRIRVSVLATLRFDGVDDLQLFDLGTQNVINALAIDAHPDNRSMITLAPCYGLSGTFTCESAEVVDVRAWPTA